MNIINKHLNSGTRIGITIAVIQFIFGILLHLLTEWQPSIPNSYLFSIGLFINVIISAYIIFNFINCYNIFENKKFGNFAFSCFITYIFTILCICIFINACYLMRFPCDNIVISMIQLPPHYINTANIPMM
jgi:hypothetical protein